MLPFRPDARRPRLQFLDDPPHGWNDTHAAWNDGKYDQWVPNKGAHDDGYLTRARHAVPLRARRRVHGLRRLLLLAAGPDRPQPLPHVDRLGRQRRQRRRPGHQQRRGRLRLVDLSGAPGARRHLLEDLPGHRRRPRRRRFWGWTDDPYIGNYGDNSLLYFHQYQNALPGDAAGRQGARPAPNISDAAATPTRCSTILRADVQHGTLPQVSWIVAPEAFTEHPNWPAELRRLVRLAGPRRLDVQPRGVEQDRAVHHLRRERRLLRPPGPAARRRAIGREGLSTVDPPTRSSPATRGLSAPARTASGMRVPMLVVSPWSKGGWVNSEVFDHTSLIRFLERRFGRPSGPDRDQHHAVAARRRAAT